MIPKDATVIVTGAGGSIGSELCRQLAHTNLILFEHSEYALYCIAQEVGGVPVLGSCLDEALVKAVWDKFRPAYVFHTAAYKHVPMLEGHNAFVGVRNNVLSTLITAGATEGRYVLISTDKAVEPSSIMGASKRLCELITTALGGSIVRFGNVMNSTGSVIPAFRSQIAKGGPVTVTHPDVERYFISISEAVRLVLAAAELPQATYMLEMQKLKIVDLARQMIADSGLQIPIEFTGLRPGEKISESIHYPAERKVATGYKDIYALHSRTPKVCHRLGWLQRGWATFEETRDWLTKILSQSPAAVGYRNLSVVKN